MSYIEHKLLNGETGIYDSRIINAGESNILLTSTVEVPPKFYDRILSNFSTSAGRGHLYFIFNDT